MSKKFLLTDIFQWSSLIGGVVQHPNGTLSCNAWLFFRDGDGSSAAWKCSIDRADNEPYYLTSSGPETQPTHGWSFSVDTIRTLTMLWQSTCCQAEQTKLRNTWQQHWHWNMKNCNFLKERTLLSIIQKNDGQEKRLRVTEKWIQWFDTQDNKQSQLFLLYHKTS